MKLYFSTVFIMCIIKIFVFFCGVSLVTGGKKKMIFSFPFHFHCFTPGFFATPLTVIHLLALLFFLLFPKKRWSILNSNIANNCSTLIAVLQSAIRSNQIRLRVCLCVRKCVSACAFARIR